MEPLPRFTLRCEREDHPQLEAGIAAGVFRKVQNRIDTNAIESGDRYESVPVPKMFTEHQGDFRTVTWYDRPRQVVWICAAGRHEVYDVARELFDADRLLPTRDDFAAVEAYRLSVERRRSEDALGRLRERVDATGSATEVLASTKVVVKRIDASLYEIALPAEAPLEVVVLLLSTVFPDQVDIEWATPERDHDGRLLRSVIVMVE